MLFLQLQYIWAEGQSANLQLKVNGRNQTKNNMEIYRSVLTEILHVQSNITILVILFSFLYLKILSPVQWCWIMCLPNHKTNNSVNSSKCRRIISQIAFSVYWVIRLWATFVYHFLKIVQPAGKRVLFSLKHHYYWRTDLKYHPKVWVVVKVQ